MFSVALWHGGRPTHDGQTVLDRLDGLFLPVCSIRASKQRLAQEVEAVTMATFPYSMLGNRDDDAWCCKELRAACR